MAPPIKEPPRLDGRVETAAVDGQLTERGGVVAVLDPGVVPLT
jgi:hypothetical protein